MMMIFGQVLGEGWVAALESDGVMRPADPSDDDKCQRAR